jgi:DNA-binding NarL/FixJ family response regulator
MVELGARDLRFAVQFALEAQATADLETFRHDLVPSLRRLVPCHTLGYTEIDSRRGVAFSISDAPPLQGVEQRFLELAHQHPMVAPQRRGDLTAHLISDFLRARDFHRLELYHDIYRPMGVEDQLAFGLSGKSIVAIHLTRQERTFTERDRQMLELVRPHLRLAYGQARESHRIRTLLQAMGSALEDRHAGVLQVDDRGRIQHASAAASELLEAYFPDAPADQQLLPRVIRDWLALRSGADTPHELTIETRRGRLRAREHLDGGPGEQRMLVLEEQRSRAPDLETLRSLGLTARQAQVLRLFACGKQSRQVAAELAITPATVEKHLEHIYRRLGVNSRAQALARIIGI